MTVIAMVTKEVEFDAGHRVHQHKSKCRNLHGHRYRVRATFKAEVQTNPGSDQGMVIDFGDLKDALMEIHDLYDHKLVLYYEDPLVEFLSKGVPQEPSAVIMTGWIPTAENFAVEIYNKLSVDWPVVKVEVYETPTSVATYEGEIRP